MNLRTLTNFVNKHSQTIFAVGATVCAVASVGFTAWGTVKAVEELEYLDKVKPNATKLDKVKKLAPLYLPAAAATAGTIGCIWKADRISVGKIAALELSLDAVKNQFKTYKSLNGEEEHKKILTEGVEKRKENVDGEGDTIHRWYEPVSKRWFEATTKDVMEACYTANRMFIGTSRCTFGMFLNLLGFDNSETWKWDNIGWYQWSGEAYYGYTWIDFNIKEMKDKKGRYYELVYPFEPHQDEK